LGINAFTDISAVCERHPSTMMLAHLFRFRKLAQFLTSTFGVLALFWCYLQHRQYYLPQREANSSFDDVNSKLSSSKRAVKCKNDGNYTIWSHPLQNDCRYATLAPTEPDIQPYVQQLRTLACKKVQDELRWDQIFPDSNTMLQYFRRGNTNVVHTPRWTIYGQRASDEYISVSE
jgi:hypothetical protein